MIRPDNASCKNTPGWACKTGIKTGRFVGGERLRPGSRRKNRPLTKPHRGFGEQSAVLFSPVISAPTVRKSFPCNIPHLFLSCYSEQHDVNFRSSANGDTHRARNIEPSHIDLLRQEFEMRPGFVAAEPSKTASTPSCVRR